MNLERQVEPVFQGDSYETLLAQRLGEGLIYMSAARILQGAAMSLVFAQDASSSAHLHVTMLLRSIVIHEPQHPASSHPRLTPDTLVQQQRENKGQAQGDGPDIPMSHAALRQLDNRLPAFCAEGSPAVHGQTVATLRPDTPTNKDQQLS